MPNLSKIVDPRFWKLWEVSGAIGRLTPHVPPPAMTPTTSISMAEAKEKLTNLQKHLPRATELTYGFGRFLADYLNPELNPMGFVMGCALAIHDLEKGVDGFTGKPIRSSLVGYPRMMYRMMQMDIPRIADAVLPADFAHQVQIILKEVDQKMAN